MDDLGTKLNKIEDSKKVAYVLERAEVHSATQACKNADITRNVYYGWTEEEREYLNGLALQLKLEVALKAKLVLRAATKEAAEVKVSGLTYKKDERIKQSAATEILDRMLGKPMQRQELKQEGEIRIIIEEVEYEGEASGLDPETERD